MKVILRPSSRMLDEVERRLRTCNDLLTARFGANISICRATTADECTNVKGACDEIYHTFLCRDNRGMRSDTGVAKARCRRRKSRGCVARRSRICHQGRDAARLPGGAGGGKTRSPKGPGPR